MKYFLILSFILILGNNVIAQNFTTYTCFNCGNINDLFADTSDNNLYLGGYIYPTNEINANGIVSFQNNQISPLVGCQAWSIQAINRFNGEFYLGGSMYSADSTEQYSLAKWNGTDLIPVIVQGQTFTFDIGSVNRIEVFNNELYICGGFRFTDSDGVIANGIAKLVNGEFKSINNFPKWHGGNNPNIVDCIALYKNELYVGGRISDTYPVDTMRHICKWNGTNWQMLGNGFSGGGGFNDIVDMQEFQGKLYIAGNFLRNGGLNSGNNLAVWTGENWEETVDVLNSMVSYGGEIFAMQVYNDELYIGGSFNSVAGIPASNFAKFDGNEWCTFLNDTLNDIVSAMEVYNGELYLAGLLSNVDGVNYMNIYNTGFNIIAKLNTSGTLFTCLDVVGMSKQKVINSEFQVNPNPSSDIIHIEWESINNIELCFLIYDYLGQIIEKKQINQNVGKNSLDIDISNFKEGVYVLDNGISKHMIVKSK